MGTRMGKSLLFMLPAFVSPGGLLVVVVPLVALRRDLKVRCNQLGLSAAKWTSDQAVLQTSLLLVTPEAALTQAFTRYLTCQRAQHRLNCTFIDGCHILLEVRDEFRSKVLSISELQKFGVPIVCMTATLAVHDKEAFHRLMWEHSNPHLRFICHSIVRPMTSDGM